MNGKERFAGAVLVITLAIGIIADVLDRQDKGQYVPAANLENQPDSCIEPNCVFKRLDINQATEQDLVILPGIGPKRATAIVEWRDRNGPFAHVDELTQVKGIGPKTLDMLKEFICVGEEGAPAGK
jgi:comEA protein